MECRRGLWRGEMKMNCGNDGSDMLTLNDLVRIQGHGPCGTTIVSSIRSPQSCP